MAITLNALKKGTNAYNNAVRSGRSTEAVRIEKGLAPGSQNAANGLKTAAPITTPKTTTTAVYATAGDLFRAHGYAPGGTLDLLNPDVKASALISTQAATGVSAGAPASNVNAKSNGASPMLALAALAALVLLGGKR